jgi:hypothetical protein
MIRFCELRSVSLYAKGMARFKVGNLKVVASNNV